MEETLFCPKCGSIMVPKKDNKNSYMVCPSCGYVEKKAKVILEEGKQKKEKKIEVIDEKESSENALPKVEMECPKCHNKEAYFWTVQTRASDEPETRFYKCTKCGHTWRDYS
ncbi:MAG: transcription factor [Candidatus Woesearchaeota archaeon]|nr:transcription factor [Candidatus Woesearchaeota archaeon]MDK2908420.1 transcription factor [Candidatus Woesearchaeota archaeon]